MHTRSLIVRILSVTVLLAIPACGNTTEPDARTGSDSTIGEEKAERPDSPSPTPSAPSPEPSEPLDPPDPSDPPKPPEPDPTDPPKPPEPDPSAELFGIDWVEVTDGEGGASTELLVHYQRSTPCAPGLRRAVVRESSSEVTIHLEREPESTRDDSMECAQVIVPESTSVTLDRPLDDRTVVDASTGEPARIGE